MLENNLNNSGLSKYDQFFSSRLFGIIVFTLFLIVSYWVMIPVLDLPPEWDSGCFMYMGKYWKEGLIPYKDMWDHKGPVLYLLNMIGVIIGGKEGVIFLQFFLSSMSLMYMYKAFQKYVHQLPAFFIATIGLLLLLLLHQTANQTEQWALFFQGLSMFLYFKHFHLAIKDRKIWLVLGFLMGCVFLIRPNQIALYMTIVIAEVVYSYFNKVKFKILFTYGILMLFGFLIPLIAFGTYFMVHNAFHEMLDCMFTFNFIYADSGKSTTIVDNIKVALTTIPFFWLVIFCILFNYGLYILKYKYVKRENWFLLLFASLWLVFEMYLSSLAGAYFLHYYIQWILPMLLMSVSFINSLQFIINDKKSLKKWQLLLSVIFFIFAAYTAVKNHAKQMDVLKAYKENNMAREKVAAIVAANSEKDDYMLEWGRVDGINFMAGRRSPSRYLYPYALDTKGYTNNKKVAEFCDEIKLNQPKFIIDASKFGRFPRFNLHDRDSFYRMNPESKELIPENINEFYQYVEDNYNYTETIGDMLIYIRKK